MEDTLASILERAIEICKLQREERHRMLLEDEMNIDDLLARGLIDQETAWDAYFCQLHECDESGFTDDRPRILAKIDTTKYNPFKSNNPGVLLLARMRMAGTDSTTTN